MAVNLFRRADLRKGRLADSLFFAPKATADYLIQLLEETRLAVVAATVSDKTTLQGIAVDFFGIASGVNATAVGRSSSAQGNNATAVGQQAAATGDNSTAVGRAASTQGAKGTALGDGATATEADTTTVGQSAESTAASATAVGQGVSVSGERSTVIGQGASSSHDDCVVVGEGSTSTASGQTVLGSGSAPINQVWLGRGITHTGSAQTTQVHATDGSGDDVAGDKIGLYAGAPTGNSHGGDIDFYTAPSGSVPPDAADELQPHVKHITIINHFGMEFYDNDGIKTAAVAAQGPYWPLRDDTELVETKGLAVYPSAVTNPIVDGDCQVGYFAAIDESGSIPARVTIDAGVVGTADSPVLVLSSIIAGGHPSLVIGNGLMVGRDLEGPSGGDKGDGTINLENDIYKQQSHPSAAVPYNNPDFVFEKYFTGKVVKTQDRPGAKEYSGLMSLDDIEKEARKSFHLPMLDRALRVSRARAKKHHLDELRDEQAEARRTDRGSRELERIGKAVAEVEGSERGDGIFDRSEALLLVVEEAYLHLIGLHKRLQSLERIGTSVNTGTSELQEA